MKNQNKKILGGTQGSSLQKGFTLVELIVVITILAILSTIGFVAYSGYLAGTRDTNRISQLKSISDGLEMYRTKHDLPMPDDYVEITASGETIAYQGYLGKNVLETIEYTSEGKDPKDGTYFSYYLTKDKKYYQLMAYLEEADNLQAFAPPSPPSPPLKGGTIKVSAIDYTSRYPTVYGKKLGILTDENNTPIQEIEDIKTNGLDVVNTTNTYIARLDDKNKITGTGAELSVLENLNKAGGIILGSCKQLLEKKNILKGKNGIYFINLNGKEIIKVYCDMTTDGGGWTRTHLLKYDALGTDREIYKKMFNTVYQYTQDSYTTDITNFDYTEFAYITSDSIENSYLNKNYSGLTIGNKNEGFSEWIDAYTSGSPNDRTKNWYYYNDFKNKNKEQVTIDTSKNPKGYRSTYSEKLLSGDNGIGENNRQSTNFPFGKQKISYNSKWCYGGKNKCDLDYSKTEWASL